MTGGVASSIGTCRINSAKAGASRPCKTKLGHDRSGYLFLIDRAGMVEPQRCQNLISLRLVAGQPDEMD